MTKALRANNSVRAFRNWMAWGAVVLAALLAAATWRERQNSALSQDLLQAVGAGNAVRAEALLSAGADPNARYREGTDDGDQTGVLERLLDALQGKSGRNPYSGETVLMRAAEIGDIHIADLLLRHGANPDAVWSQSTALKVAARRGFPAIVGRLLKAGANPNLAGPGNSPLMLASARGHVDVMELLIASGADVNAVNMGGDTALLQASSNNQVKALKRLLAAGASPGPRDGRGLTAAAIVARRAGAMATYKLLASTASELAR